MPDIDAKTLSDRSLARGLMTRRAALSGVAAIAIALTAGAAGTVHAQSWPSKPITVIVAYPAGGGTDISIRSMTDRLSEKLGQPILVQNVAGAGGGVAAARVARSAPDGYTVLATNSTSITLAPLVQKATYDMDSFVHVAMIGEFQNAVFANIKMPFSNLDELVAHVKQRGRPMTFASQLAIDRLLMGYIAKERGIELRPVPVSGGAGAVQAALAGDVDVTFSGGSWAPIVKAGDAKVLFAASYERLKLAPDLQSMKDLGFPFGVTAHISLHAPAGTPQAIVNRLADAFEDAVNTDRVQTVGQQRFMDMTSQNHAKAKATMELERKTYQELIKIVGGLGGN
jgi:tripartite-type tricarboxylate transporter receptor subunit TctC